MPHRLVSQGEIMVKTVNVQEAQAQLPALLALAQAGNEIVIEDENHFRLQLVPLKPASRPRVFDLHPGAMNPTDDFDAPLPDDFWDASL